MRIGGEGGLGVVEVVDGVVGASVAASSSLSTTASEAGSLPPDLSRSSMSSRDVSYDKLGEFNNC